MKLNVATSKIKHVMLNLFQHRKIVQPCDPEINSGRRHILLLILTLCFGITCAFASDTYVLKAGISLDKIPKEFYGTWRVSSQLVSSNTDEIFKKNNVDLWNLSRVGDVITLDNPFSGAKASISIDEVNGKLIRFKKIGDYDSKKLTDTVQLNLGKETFTGTSSLKLETISELDGHVLKSQWATYKLTGEKISGASVK